MLANAPNGKISEALAQICTKEGISLKKVNPADDDGDEDFTPVVYVARVRAVCLKYRALVR